MVVNYSDTGAFTVMLNSRVLTFEATSAALTVNVEVVFEPTVEKPEI